MLYAVIWIVVIIVCLYGAYRFAQRDPDRTIQPFDGYLSPADGIVTDIVKVGGKKQHIPKKKHGITAFLDDFPEGKVVVLIMMKFWHVHVQRIPFAGTVEMITHKDGTFKNAVFGDYRKASVENEHMAFTVKGKKPCKIYLIAGLVARRIKARVQAGTSLHQGEKIGHIFFGSQVAIVLPKSEVLVKEGQFVQAGLTKLAK